MSFAATESRPQDNVSTAGTGLRILSVGDVDLNLDGFHATVYGHNVPLTPKELDMLRLLMENAGRVLTRQQLRDACWERGHYDPANTVDVYIRRLRQKIEQSPHHPTHIRTIRGVGYIFDTP